MTRWTVDAIPDLHGQVAIITGANSGLGLELTRALAARGARVIMACRSLDKAQQAQARLKAEIPQASLEVMQLDLTSLASVRAFATDFPARHDRLDLLFNNAGVMAMPRRETEDGFELQIGTNHLSHFALTGLLLPTLLSTPHSRIVTTTSIARAFGRIHFDDLNGKRSYNRWLAYGQSKQANLLFALELHRRLAGAKAPTISVAAHPGFAHTELQPKSAAASGSTLERIFYATLGSLMSQSPQMGALPLLYAATSSDIQGGELVGPVGFLKLRGYPKVEVKHKPEDKKLTAARLWKLSVELTGVDYAPLQTQESKV